MGSVNTALHERVGAAFPAFRRSGVQWGRRSVVYRREVRDRRCPG